MAAEPGNLSIKQGRLLALLKTTIHVRPLAALILQQTFQERAPFKDTGCHLARQLPWHALENCSQDSQALSWVKGSMALPCQACKQTQGSRSQAKACPGTPLDARARLALRADAWRRTE